MDWSDVIAVLHESRPQAVGQPRVRACGCSPPYSLCLLATSLPSSVVGAVRHSTAEVKCHCVCGCALPLSYTLPPSLPPSLPLSLPPSLSPSPDDVPAGRQSWVPGPPERLRQLLPQPLPPHAPPLGPLCLGEKGSRAAGLH